MGLAINSTHLHRASGNLVVDVYNVPLIGYFFILMGSLNYFCIDNVIFCVL
jgi:uncharacterized membrane protein